MTRPSVFESQTASSPGVPARRGWLVAPAWMLSSCVVGLVCKLQPQLPSYAATWLTIGAVFMGMKAIVLTTAGKAALRALGIWKSLGFLFLWPGMAIRPFVVKARRQIGVLPFWRLVQFGAINAAAGAVLLWVAAQSTPLRSHPWLRGAMGLAGSGLLGPFGAFQLLAAFWRACGLAVEKQWDWLPGSRSLAEYWSVRWNRSFHDFAREHVFAPLKRQAGSTAALFGSFLFSGVLHDLAISLPARGGYGLPTLYFAVQGAGIWLERRYLTSGWARRSWAAVVLIAPLGLLFHQPFLSRVILPQLDALAAG